MPYLDDAYRELAEVEAYARRIQSAEVRARSVDPERAAELNRLADRHPHLNAAAAMGFVRSPRRTGEQMMEKLGELSTYEWMRAHPAGAAGSPTETPGARRARLRGDIFSQMSQFLEQNREWDTQRDIAALPAPMRQELNNAIESAQQAGIFDKDGIAHEPSARESAKSAAFHRMQDAIVRAGQPFTYLSTEGKPYRATREAWEDLGPEAHHSYAQDEKQYLADPETRIKLERLDQPPGPRHARDTDGGGGGLQITPMRQASSGLEGEMKGLARTTFQTLDMPVQELQGQIRNVYGQLHGKHVDWTEPQSDLLIQAMTGKESGSGFFTDPESEVAEERRRREAERGKIGGHNVTLGRWAADVLTPFDPDSKPFNLASGLVDLGVQIADPSAFALGKLGKAGQAGKLFRAADALDEEAEVGAGLVRGLADRIRGRDYRAWIDSPDGQARIAWLRDHNDVYDIYEGLNRKVNFDLATQFADTRTDQEVRTLLENNLGRSIREVDTVSMGAAGNIPNPGSQMARDLRVGRIPGDMPARGPIDATNKDLVGRELEKWLHVGGAPREVIAKHVGAVARSENDIQTYNAVRDALRAEEGILRQEGFSEPLIKKLTKMHEDANREGSRTWLDTVTHQGQTDEMINIGGEPGWDAGAHLYVEHAPEQITLPDIRNIRRVRSKYSWFLANSESGKLRAPWAVLEAIQNDLWKPLQLATRIAWPVRVIGEEQIRLAAAGYDSMFRHPLSFIAIRTGHKADVDVLDNAIDLAHEAKESMSKVHGEWVDDAVKVGRKNIWYKTDIANRDHFDEAVASEITRLAHDPVAREVARADSLDAVKDWFSRGEGMEFSGPMSQAHKSKWDRLGGNDGYIDSVSKRIHYATGGNEELLDAVRHARFQGKDLLDGNKVEKGFVQHIRDMDDELKPGAIVGDEVLEDHPRGAELLDRWNHVVDKMFGLLMTNRTNNLSRVPHFKQSYWREAERLLPFLAKHDQQAFLRAARNANLDGWQLGSRTLRRMERTASRSAGEDLPLKQLDELAKGHALDSTKELLYDLTKKGSVMDAWRLIFPFGEAWKEVMITWFGRAGLLWKNPKTIRRFQQLLQGARSPELNEMIGGVPGEGFFHENQFGEMVFTYPGTRFLTEKLLGVPVPLTGRVQGLSMFGTIMPGFGPVAQIPAGWFLANKPGPDFLKKVMTEVLNFDLKDVTGLELGTVGEQVLPFGSIGQSDQSDIFSAFSYVPPWMKAAGQFFFNGDVNGRQWNTTVMEVAGYLKSTGEYGESVGEQNRLLDDAQLRARRLYLIKAFVALGAPASPDREWLVESNNGALLRAVGLADELRKMREDDFDTADRRFLDKYGEDLLGVIGTSMTTSANYATPGTRQGVEWVARNPGVEDALPNTYGFFAPEGGPMDLSLYSEDFRRGERVRLDPKNWIRLMNDTMGNLHYKEAQDEVGEDAGTDEGRAFLRDVRDWINEEYPGWRNEKGELEKAPTDALIREFYDALDNKAAMKTDAGKGLKLYLEGRDEVLAYAEDNDMAWPSKSEDLADARAYLADLANWVIERHPDFARLYDFVLSRETEEEDND